MILRLIGGLLFALCIADAEPGKLSALIIDGVNNHDWAAGTRAIQTILEGTGRFRVTVATWPARADFSKFDVVINNFNGGHLATGQRWPREMEQALVDYVRNGGGLVVYHAANNAFLEWPEYNDMIGLGWRDPSFGEGRAVVNGAVTVVPKGSGLPPGHGPRHDFELFVLDRKHPITSGLPAHWTHPSEQLTHGQHGPAQGLTILTYAFSEVSQQGEPMDWVRQYGRGRVYTTMLGHTWKNEANPNLDDLGFQTLLARGTEWAATGRVTLPVNLQKVGTAEEEAEFDGGVFQGIGAVDDVALNGFGVELADGACGGIRGVGGAHDFAEFDYRVFTLESHDDDRAAGHELNETTEKGALFVNAVESFGFLLGHVDHPQAGDFETGFFERGEDLAGKAILDGVGLDDGESTLHVKKVLSASGFLRRFQRESCIR
jgi:uncharacterized protein